MRIEALLLSLLLLTLGGAAAADSGQLDHFHGDWQRVTAEKDEARIRAIDKALAELSWVTRTMAAPILRRSTTPPERYVFQVDNTGITLGQRGREPRPLLLDGTEREFEGDQGSVTTSAERLEEAIATRWKTSQAHGSNTFRLQDHGTTLVVESVLQITAISGVEAITYETRFARTPAVSSAGGSRD